MQIGFDRSGGTIVLASPERDLDPLAPRPMLAYRVEKTGYPGRPICQPKIDGVRAILTSDGLFTRYGRRIASCPQISFDGGDSPLDGEIYAHGTPIETIAGSVRSADPTEASLALQFHVFDTLDAAPAADRQRMLDARASGFALGLCRVETVRPRSRAELERYYLSCLARGYEGMMMREPDAAYSPRRSTALIKRKPFEDFEARILSVQTKDNRAVAATLLAPDGQTFNAFLRASHSARLSLARNAGLAIGCEATVRHWGRTTRGLPRHAVVHQIH